MSLSARALTKGTGEKLSRDRAPPLAPETPWQAGEVGEGSKQISQCSGTLGEGAPFRYLQEAQGTLLIGLAGGLRGRISEWSGHAWLLSFRLLTPAPTQPPGGSMAGPVPSWCGCPAEAPSLDRVPEMGERATWAQRRGPWEQRTLCLGPHLPGQQACVQLPRTRSWLSAHRPLSQCR